MRWTRMTILKDAGEPGDDTTPEFFRGDQFRVVGNTTQDVSVIIGVDTANGNMHIQYPPLNNDPKHLRSSEISHKFMQIRGHKIDERAGREDLYPDGITIFKAKELDYMLDEAYKEVVEAPR
jgi:hypothetical protein